MRLSPKEFSGWETEETEKKPLEGAEENQQVVGSRSQGAINGFGQRKLSMTSVGYASVE